MSRFSKYRLIAALTLLTLETSLQGCGLFKRMGAGDPNTLMATTAAIAHQMAPGADLTRSSNAATFLRLKTLFPSAALPGSGGTTLLAPDQFNTLYSTGLNRSITAEGRSTTTVAQLGLRKWAATLCKSYAEGSSAGALFSTSGILLSGESLPQDKATLLAFAATRNAWLAPVTSGGLEVQALVNEYQTVLASDSEPVARQAVCMAVLLAPQFWVGTGGQVDSLRRAALEIGRHVPTFAEMDGLISGKFTLNDYVKKLQTDTQLQPGYLSAVRDWHQDWWGLRDFQSVRDSTQFTPDGYYKVIEDPRGMQYSNNLNGFGELKGNLSYTIKVLSDTIPFVRVGGYYGATYFGSDDNEDCLAESNGTPNVQPFDPRTELVTFEHKLPGTTQWEIVGGFVLNTPAAISRYTTLVNAAGGSFNFATQCVLHGDKYPTTGPHASDLLYAGGAMSVFNRDVTGYPRYYECGGLASLPSNAGYKPTLLSDFRTFSGWSSSGDASRPNRYDAKWSYEPGNPSPISGLHPNSLVGTVHETWSYTDRRIRRYAPGGNIQNGVSAVSRWYTGSKAYVCNSFERYLVSCVFRPPNNPNIAWHDASAIPGYFGAGAPFMHDGAYYSPTSAANPLILNQFRCGVPDVSSLPTSGSAANVVAATAAVEESAFPHAYAFDSTNGYTGSLGPVNNTALFAPTHTGYHYITPTVRDTNGTAYSAGFAEETQTPEYQGIRRLTIDLNNEPYYLLNYILTNNKPYSDVFTANYTFGHEELELFYRSQGQQLPAYPPGYSGPPPFAPNAPLKQFSRDLFSSLPLSWFMNSMGTTYSDWTTNAHATTSPFARTNGYLPPPHTAGILTMPAFLGPVSQKMRTVSARVFTRLLCGDPNVFTPTGGQIGLHQQYMSTASNPAPVQHLTNSSCRSCHINLDPLAAALSSNFLRFVQKDESGAMNGEFMIHGTDWRGSANTLGGPNRLGVRSSGDIGQGAFLGQAVAGFKGVGEVLADAPLAYQCTVDRTFQEILGRPLQFSDAQIVKTITDTFYQTRDFNQMIRDIVTKTSFSKAK